MKLSTPRIALAAALASLLLMAGAATAAVLPFERADALYHSYNGGGIEVTGPSILVRKNFKEKFSVWGNWYKDFVTSASIDVEMSGASEYTEERTETSAGVDYLRGKALLSLFWTKSSENDYEASTYGLSVSQDMFGDLTTLTMGYAVGGDTVRDSTNEDFEETIDRQIYRLGLSQILTPNLIMALNYEGISDEGYLNNPYRSVRYVDPADPTNFLLEPERYPDTRSSNAVSLSGRYFLPYRAVVKASYRWFNDTWGITAHNVELGYIHPFKERWIIEGRLRFYEQGAADFYADLFPREDYQNFLARDKEMSSFSSTSIGISASYDLDGFGFIDRGSLNFSWDRFMYEYDDFRDATAEGYAAGEEPLYSFEADVIQLFFSVWY